MHKTHTGSRLRTRAGPTQHRPEIGHDDLDAKDVQQLAQENRRRNLHGSLPGGWYVSRPCDTRRCPADAPVRARCCHGRVLVPDLRRETAAGQLQGATAWTVRPGRRR